MNGVSTYPGVSKIRTTSDFLLAIEHTSGHYFGPNACPGKLYTGGGSRIDYVSDTCYHSQFQ
jgi:hypothetical protein